MRSRSGSARRRQIAMASDGRTRRTLFSAGAHEIKLTSGEPPLLARLSTLTWRSMPPELSARLNDRSAFWRMLASRRDPLRLRHIDGGNPQGQRAPRGGGYSSITCPRRNSSGRLTVSKWWSWEQSSRRDKPGYDPTHLRPPSTCRRSQYQRRSWRSLKAFSVNCAKLG